MRARPARERRRSREELQQRTPADGVIGGLADIDGGASVVVSYDYTVLAGTQGMRGHLKKDRLFELAEKRRLNQRFDAERAVLQPIWAAKPAVPEAAAAER